MANIKKKDFKELSEDSKRIIREVREKIKKGVFPLTICDVDVRVDDMVDVMKYLIDTIFQNSKDLYARKIRYFDQSNFAHLGLCFSSDEAYFEYISRHGVCEVFFQDVEVVGQNKSSQRSGIHDGDVYLKLEDGSLVCKDEYEQIKYNKVFSKRKI